METVKEKFEELLTLDKHKLAKATGVPVTKVHETLMESSEAYQRNQAVKSVKKMRGYQVYNFGSLVHVDLMFLSTPTNSTQHVVIDSWKYLVITVDVYSRLLTVRPTKTKRASEVGAALREIVQEMRERYYNGADYFPFKLLVDGGTEFSQNTLGENTTLIRTHSKHGASLAERYIRTLRDKIRIAGRNKLSLEELYKIVDRINDDAKGTISSKGYSATEMVDGFDKKPDKNIKVWPEPEDYKFPLGSYVRIVNYGEKFDRVFVKKSAFSNYTEKIYSIYERSLDTIQNIPVYTVVSLDGNFISGHLWYEEELLGIPTDYVRKMTNEECDVHEDFTSEEVKVFQLSSVNRF